MQHTIILQATPPTDDYVTAQQLNLTAVQIREAYPHATELVSLDGLLCWEAAVLIGGSIE